MEDGAEHLTLRRCELDRSPGRGDEVRVVGQLGHRSDPGVPGAPGSELGTASTGKVKRRSQSGIDAEKAAPDAPGNGACEKRTRGRPAAAAAAAAAAAEKTTVQ